MNKIAALIFFLINLPLFAQETPIKHSPAGLLDKVFDRFGKEHILDEIRIIKDENNPNVPQNYIQSTLLCSSGYFDLYFENGSGMEGNSGIDVIRRNVLCQVFSDLSQFIVPANPNVKVNILVRNINTELPGYHPISNPNPSQTSGVLGLATGFYVVPLTTPPVSGIADNEIWKTINSGVDSYTSVASPLMANAAGAMFYHGMVAFNFENPTMNWHTDLSLITASGLYDLYSVALHELTHALGFASLIDGTGNSKLGSNFPYFSRYDTFLKTQGNTPLITNTGACSSLYDYTFNPSLTPSTVLTPSSPNCSNQLLFTGSVNQALYTPSSYSEGSSFSHLEDTCHSPNTYPDNLYYTMSEANGTGPTYMKRFLKSEERTVLCDLGYQVNTTYGNVLHHSNETYSGGMCSGLQVAGVNDGITALGAFQYVVNAGSSISLATILSNDYNANSFECLEVIYGGGSVVGTTYYSVNPGIILLRYVPVNSTANTKGNITYVIVYATSGNCVPTTCSMLNNNDFESSTTCGEMGYTSPLVETDCWMRCTNTPDIFQRNCSNTTAGWNYNLSIPALHQNYPGTDSWNGTPNNNFIGIASLADSYGQQTHESFQSLLNLPLIPGQTYQISFRAKVGYNSAMNLPPLGTNGQITIGTSSTSLVPITNFFSVLPSAITPLGSPISIINHADYISNSSNTWDLYSQTFTYSGATNNMNFILINSSYLGVATPSTLQSIYIYIDDIELIAIDTVNTLTIPSSLCTNSLITDLSIYAPVPNGVFSGTGVQNSGGIYSFDASQAGIGSHIITYTYTNNNGCSVNIYDTIIVSSLLSPSVSVTPSSSSICLGDSVSLTASGADTYIWSPATGLSATTGTTVTATPTATTTYTITGTNSASGCTNSTTVTVTINPLPTISVSPTTASICQGGSVSLTASGADTYTWSPATGLSATAGATVTANPTATTTYTITGTNSASGCSNTSTKTVTVNPNPSVSVSPTSSTICQGQSTTLTASGANTYSWSPATGLSATTGATVTATPSTTTTYTVSGTTSAGCVNTQTITVTVNPNPTVSVSPTSSSVCQGQSVTLTASGANTYTWSPGTGLSATTGATVTATPSTMITYTVTGNQAGCTGTATTTIVVNACIDCGTGPIYSGGSISPAPNQIIRITNPITITGNVTFSGNAVKIYPGVNIYVQPGAVLNINGSHLYGCQDMWGGITVYPGGRVKISNYLDTLKTTLIEDAKVAIDFLPLTNQQTNILLDVNRATFNRNDVAINIQGYPFANAASMFNVRNSLFTCRNIYNTANPTNWPATGVVKAASGSTNPYANPYIPSTYSVSTSLKAPITNTFSNVGIHLKDVGSTVNTIPTTYNSVTIGSSVVSEYNVFDNLKTDIYCYNTNLNLVNTTMQFPQIITATMYYQQNMPNIGTGVFTDADSLHKCIVSILGGATFLNKFYNLSRALHTNNYYNVVFYKNTVRSLRTELYNSSGYFNGNMAVYTSSKEFENLNISYNAIYNISSAISFLYNGYVPSTAVAVNMNYNTILQNLGTTIGAVGSDAIHVSNALTASSYYGTVNIKSNAINGYTRGITLLNWHKTAINAQDNNITLALDPNAFVGSPSYGIAVNNCMSTGSPKNKITGNTILGFSQLHESYKAIAFTQSFGNDLHCNSVRNTHTGLYFNGVGSVNTYKNTMQEHRYGFVLDNNGIIGQQGSTTTPADNRWLGGTAWSTTGTANGNFKNACLNGSLTDNSKMYTRAAANYTPNGSGYNQGLGDKSYTTMSPASLFHISASIFSPCPLSAVPMPFGITSTAESVLPMEATALAISGTPEQQVVVQNQIYRIEESAPSVNMLSGLSELENNSNIATLWNVEKLVLAGNIALAANENGTIQPQNALEEAYQQYYQLLIKSTTQAFTTSDSLELTTLAQGCPAVVGASVYQAATLYNRVYQRADVFESNCTSYSARGMQENEQRMAEEINRAFQIYPVPNDGSFTVQGDLKQGDYVCVLNLDGKEILNQYITEDSMIIELDTNLRSGAYFVSIHDAFGKLKYHHKMIVTN